MADTPSPDLLVELCDWIAERLGIVRTALPYALWAHSIEEVLGNGGVSNVADPATVLRRYGGNGPVMTPDRTASVQIYTIASLTAAAMAFGQAVADVLLDSEGLPLQRVQLPHFLVFGFVGLTAPGLIGRDSKNRAEVVSIFEIYYAVNLTGQSA